MEEFLKALAAMSFSRGLGIVAVVGFGVFARVKVFGHMEKGFGPFNVRITGIVIVAALASTLAVLSPTIREWSYWSARCNRGLFVWLWLERIKLNITIFSAGRGVTSAHCLVTVVRAG